MKHAFLILAHAEFEILRRLVACLDDGRNDIYVHFDRKVASLPKLQTQKATLHILSDRVDVRWGDFSMIRAEYLLFEAASAHGPYLYYHLLSGVDLPLKSQDFIHAFFDAHQGTEFIGFMYNLTEKQLYERFQYRYLFPRDFRKYWGLKRTLRIGFFHLQQGLGLKRNTGITFMKGSQWVSVTEEMVRLFLEKKKWVTKVFRDTFCSDESVFQTLCWLSPLKDKLYDINDDGKGCMRLIGWRSNGQLEEWTRADFDTIKNSPYLFARKFDYSDPAFIQDILELTR